MARDEIFKTEEKIFMSAIKVRELIHEDNLSHILLKTGKIYHKRSIGTETNCHKPGKPNNAEKTQNKKIQSTIRKKK